MDGTSGSKKKMSVASPVEGKDGKTYWRSMGIGFMNSQGGISIILEGLPVNGRLYVSDWPSWKDQPRQRDMPSLGDAPVMPPPANDLPF